MSAQVIVFTANNRPRYMAQTLDAWSRVRGIGDCRLLFFCEPRCPEMADLCGTASDFAGAVTVTVHEERHGVLRNPHTALTAGFALDDFVILAEDDLIPADDTLEFLAWCREKYAGDHQVIAASASRIDEHPGGPSGVMRLDRFHCWIWGTWRDRWERLIGPDWDFDYSRGGWDWRINNHWVRDLGYRVAAPCLSRSQHIGREGGIHCTSPEIFEATRSRSFSLAYGRQDYMEVLG